MTRARATSPRLISVVLVLATLVLAGKALAASRPPALSAAAAIVVDARTGDVLFAKRPNAVREIASTTKLMTAYVVLERATQSQVFSAPAYVPGDQESVIGLRKGERMTVHDLLRALLLPSANDAAWDLAYNLGGHSVRSFVRDMNREARRLGLRRTRYANPIGLDDPLNHSTAADLARLAAIDMQVPAFARIVGLTRAKLRSGSHTRLVINRNDLVARYPFVDGVKTGHTVQAGYVLVGAAHRAGANVISVVLGEPNVHKRDADSLALLRWGLAQYHRVHVLNGLRTMARLPIREHGGTAPVRPADSLTITVRRGVPLTVRRILPKELDGPLRAGHTAGRAEVLVAGRVVRSVPLVTAARVPGPTFARRLATVARDAVITLAIVAVVVAGTLVALRVRVLRRRRARSTR